MKAPGRREGVVTRVAVGVIVLAVLQTVSAQKPAAPSVGTVAAGQPIAGFEYDVTNQPKWQDLTSPQPKISLTFSVKRRDATFEALQQSGVSATISGSPITIHEFTTNTTPPPARVVLVLDGSLSMLPQGNAQTPAQLVGKLEPAKIAIIDFLENLLQRPDDAVAVWQFNQSSTPLFLMGSDKTDAIEAVDQFQIDRDTAGQDTFLYQALQDGLAYARAQGVQHLIFVTDGVEDTPDFNRKSTEEQAQHQRDQEQLALASSQDGAPIRVHTVAIGNRNADRRKDAEKYTYVDTGTLERVSNGTGGQAHYIDIPELSRQAQDRAAYRNALAGSLKGVLAEIRRSFQYDHRLTLALTPAQLPQPGHAAMVHIEGRLRNANGEVVLPLTFTVSEPMGDGNVTVPGRRPSPSIGRAEGGPAVFLPFQRPPDPKAPKGQQPSDPSSQSGADPLLNRLSSTYFAFLVPLLALSTIPGVLRWADARREARVARRLVTIVKTGSPLVGQECGVEQNKLGRDFLIQEGNAVIVCPGCGKPHHLGCWHLVGDRCNVRVCKRSLAIPPDVLARFGVETSTTQERRA